MGKRGDHTKHYHILLLIKKEDLPCKAEVLNAEKLIWKVMLENWVRNVGSTKKPEYKKLLTYRECWRNGKLHRNYDCRWVNPGISEAGGGIEDTAWYIMKYLLKDSGKERRRQQALKLNLPQQEYEQAWETIKTKCFYSKYFGLDAEVNPWGDVTPNEDIVKHIREGIQHGKGKFNYPIWINPNNGKTFPLCKYYRDRFMTIKDLADYYVEEESKQKQNQQELEKYKHKLDTIERKERKDQKIWNMQNQSELEDTLEILNN